MSEDLTEAKFEELLDNLLQGLAPKVNYTQELLGKELATRVTEFAAGYVQAFDDLLATLQPGQNIKELSHKNLYDYLEANLTPAVTLGMEAGLLNQRHGNHDGPAPANLMAMCARHLYENPDPVLSEKFMQYIKAYRQRKHDLA